MRALVDLYHETPAFITREVLNMEIDRAFIASQDTVGQMFANVTFHELWRKRMQRRALPKIGRMTDSPREDTSKNPQSRTWSMEESERERQVTEALYGATKERPGVEALFEEAPRIIEHNRQDREREVSLSLFLYFWRLISCSAAAKTRSLDYISIHFVCSCYILPQ